MGITDLINAAKQYSKVNEKKLREAYAFAEMAHSGQTRMSGEPYITHPLAVAMLLASYKADEDSLVVALLHDVIEDTPHELKEIEAQFGKSVARMVDAMTKLPSANLIQPPQASHFDSRIESIRKIFEVMQEDVRVIVIKLCDRLHNMETLSHFRSEKQKRIAQETLDIYVKIAERLGIGDLREKLENLSNQYLFPEEYKNIQAATQREHQKFGALSKKIMTLLRSDHFLSSAQKIHIRHMFSYEKVFSEGIQETPPDAVVSLLFAREEDCYLALRSVHSLWKVVRGGVQDYIALPRSNGYQALETSTIKNEGGVIKFVLQTQRMYDYSQFGIMLQCFSDEKSDKIVVLPWVQHLKKVHHGTRQSSNDYMLALESDVLKGSIIVYTDDNKTIFLPPQSTALDAAFFLLGKKARNITRIFINEKEHILSTFLGDGDKVRFQMGSRDNLHFDWIENINTAYSKYIIHEIIQEMGHHKRVVVGEQLLQIELNKRKFGYLEEIDDKTIKKLFSSYHISSRNELCLQLAEGNLSVSQACDIIFSVKKNQKPHTYLLEIETHPNKYDALSSIFSLLNGKKISLESFSVLNHGHDSLLVKAFVSFPYQHYTSVLKSLKGIPDLRSIRLQDSRRINLARGLIVLFIILVALDPIVTYYMINTLQVYFLDLLTIRFWSIFLVLSLILFIKRAVTKSPLESPVRYYDKDFVISAVALFSTAFFTYLAFDSHITPFYYQLAIYLLLFPFVLFSEQHRNILAFLAVIALNTLLYFYIFRLLMTEVFSYHLTLYALFASVSFILYTYFSLEFQKKEHIHRRYLSFFKTLALYGALLSVLPHLFRSAFEIPSLPNIIISFSFSVIFILVPYILYFIISGLYEYNVPIWRKFIMVLLLVKIAENLFLGFPWSTADFAITMIFIMGYWIYSSVVLPRRSSISPQPEI